jgi:hypothetical protein
MRTKANKTRTDDDYFPFRSPALVKALAGTALRADPGIGNHVLERINDACLRSGIPLAETFLSKWFVEHLDEPPPPEVEDRWFAPEEGFDWIRRVRQELSTYPNDWKNQAAVSGLDGYEKQLRHAREAGARWKPAGA